MQSVFDSYAKPGTDKKGNPNGYDVRCGLMRVLNISRVSAHARATHHVAMGSKCVIYRRPG